MPLNPTNGSIGVGAMIIFIALILVASVSTTVIINQAENIRDQSESTSDGLQNDLSRKVKMVGANIAGGVECTAQLWQHSGFTGWAVTFEVGNYNRGAMEGLGATDNDASSIIVGSGCNIVMYEGENFDGSWVASFGAGNHGLSSIEAAGAGNDEISSIKVMSFSLLLFLRLNAGSPSIMVDDISTSTTCQNGDTLSTDYSTLVDSGSRLVDDKNTFGEDVNIASGELIDYGMTVKVEMAFSFCVPTFDDRVEVTINVNYGSNSVTTLAFNSLDLGFDLFHQP